MISGTLPLGITNSVTTPLGLMRPIRLVPFSANHRLPSGPAVMPAGLLLSVGIGNSVIIPASVIRPMRLVPVVSAPDSTNQRLLSGPLVMPCGWLLVVGIEVSVIVPSIAMRPILLPKSSVNHSALSGPRVMLAGPLSGG